MKLIRVKILGENFRSLTANEDYKFNITSQENRLSNKVFAGLNGSGKSNFLELLAEIFYYLERYHLDSTPKDYKRSKNIGFEIEYLLPIKNIKTVFKSFTLVDDTLKSDLHVKIYKPLNEDPEFSYSEIGKNNFIRQDHNTDQLLPSKIIAYTSGQNELLSNPFFRLRYHYLKEFKKLKGESFSDRLFFLNSESNYAIFISNLLLGDKVQLKYLKETFKIADLSSFRIVINYKKKGKENLQFSNVINGYISKLKSCATIWVDREESKCIIMDFEINEASHLAFKHFFETPFKLFNVFYQLESLNLLLEKTSTIGFVTRAHKTINITDELSKPDPSDLVFRIEKIKIHKLDRNDKMSEIYYKSLSDGEHQFNGVIGSVMMMEDEGCLFLMDEPDTHFNPIWRAKMVDMLNHVSAKSYSSDGRPELIRKQEVILTTHSPFLISDSFREDVYKFEYDKKILTLKRPEYETYGTSINFILETIFDRDITISDFSYDEMERLKLSIKNLDDVKRVKRELRKFGESVEKFDAYSYLMEKEKEFKIDKDAN